ncbi:hypothetical protein [Novosphingobium sp.]|uniref:hypothetical protein n=1 Tax=Novosphingobium sp. TaxID=1874826 RepID=UPI0035B2D098
MRWLAAAGGAAALAMGCAAHSQQAPVAPPPAAEAEAEQVAARLADACAACHPATTYTTKRYDAVRWGEVIDQMIDKGAEVSDADYQAFVAYLSARYGPDAKP